MNSFVSDCTNCLFKTIHVFLSNVLSEKLVYFLSLTTFSGIGLVRLLLNSEFKHL